MAAEDADSSYEMDGLLSSSRSAEDADSQSTPVDRAIRLSFHIHFTARVCLYLALATVVIALCAAAVLLLLQHVPVLATVPVSAAVPVTVVAAADVDHPLYSRWLPFCNSTQQNIVLHRNDEFNFQGGEQERPWSVNNRTFLTTQPYCQTAPQLLDALHYGVRRPLPGYDFVPEGRERARVEWAQSWFEPAGCSMRWYDGDAICGILNRFSHVVMAGDSLSRHVNQGLYILLTGDLRYGGLPRLSRQKGLFDRCQCDGQFSEHSVCREYEWGHMFDVNDTRIYGVCTHTNDNSFALLTLQTYDGKLPDNALQPLCSNDTRPRFLMLQSSAHYDSRVDETMRRFLNPLLDRIAAIRSACPWRFQLYMAWASAPAQSRLLDRKYPHQSRERIVEYNTAMEAQMATRSIPAVHYWNATLNAATSDGFHYLTDVNLLRANSIINYLALLDTTNAATTT